MNGEVITLFPLTQPQPKRTPFWLTVAQFPNHCEECNAHIGVNGDLLYRHEPKTVLCRDCGDRLGIEYTPSKRWLELERELGADGIRMRPPGAA